MKKSLKVKELQQFMVMVKDKTGTVVTKRSAFSRYAAKQVVATFEAKYGEGYTVEKQVA